MTAADISNTFCPAGNRYWPPAWGVGAFIAAGWHPPSGAVPDAPVRALEWQS